MARNFNGTSSKIVLPTGASRFKPSGAFSACAWCRQPSFSSSYPTLFGDWTGNGAAVFARTGGSFAAYTGGGTSIDLSTLTVSVGAWGHVAMTVRAQDNTAGSLKLYINGVLDSPFVGAAGAIIWPGNWEIGADDLGGGGTWFNGDIAEFGFWNIELTAGEVAALAKGIRVSTIRPTALVSYLPIDGLSSPEPDLSSFAGNGTVTNATLIDGPPMTTFTPRWPIRYESIDTTIAIYNNIDIIKPTFRPIAY